MSVFKILSKESASISSILHWVLRLACAGCFIGHGAWGIIAKEGWLPFFDIVSIPPEIAFLIMPLVGIMDITLGVLILIKPMRAVLLWMTIWSVWTALCRPLAGFGMWEFWERAGNYGVPLTFLLWAGIRPGLSSWFVRIEQNETRITKENVALLIKLLAVTTGLLLIGHGGFGFFQAKQALINHWAAIGLPFGAMHPELWVRGIGCFEIALGVAVLIPGLLMQLKGLRSLLIFIFFWKLGTELLYPIAGRFVDTWEWIERAGSYGAPIGLALLITWYLSNVEKDLKTISTLDEEEEINSSRVPSSVVPIAIFTIVLSLGSPLVRIPAAIIPSSGDIAPSVKPLRTKIISGQKLLNRLHAGGLILYIRHFDTLAKSVFDDESSMLKRQADLSLKDLKDCDWQRPLSDYGIKRARLAGVGFRKLNIPMGKFVSSPYCRTVESAIEMFGAMPDLDKNLVFRKGNYSRYDMEEYLKPMLGEKPLPGTNTVIMAHRPQMDAIGHIADGETFVFEALGESHFNFIGRIKSHEWLEAASDASFLGGAWHAPTLEIVRNTQRYSLKN